MVEPDAAVLEGELLDRGGLVGVAVQPGLVQHRVQGQDPVVPSAHRQVPVHERHRLLRQGGAGAGDLAGLPGLQPAVLDQRPQPGQPEAQLDGLAHQPQPGGEGQVQRGGELLHGVLRDARGADPGQRDLVVERHAVAQGSAAGAGPEHRGRLLLGDRVQVHPVHRRGQQPGLLVVRVAAGRDHRVQGGRPVQVTQVGHRSVRLAHQVRRRGHESNLDATTDTSGPR